MNEVMPGLWELQRRGMVVRVCFVCVMEGGKGWRQVEQNFSLEMMEEQNGKHCLETQEGLGPVLF